MANETDPRLTALPESGHWQYGPTMLGSLCLAVDEKGSLFVLEQQGYYPATLTSSRLRRDYRQLQQESGDE